MAAEETTPFRGEALAEYEEYEEECAPPFVYRRGARFCAAHPRWFTRGCCDAQNGDDDVSNKNNLSGQEGESQNGANEESNKHEPSGHESESKNGSNDESNKRSCAWMAARMAARMAEDCIPFTLHGKELCMEFDKDYDIAELHGVWKQTIAVDHGIVVVPPSRNSDWVRVHRVQGSCAGPIKRGDYVVAVDDVRGKCRGRDIHDHLRSGVFKDMVITVARYESTAKRQRTTTGR